MKQLLAVLLLAVCAFAQIPSEPPEIPYHSGVPTFGQPHIEAPVGPVIGQPFTPLKRPWPLRWLLHPKKRIQIKTDAQEPLAALYKCFDRIGRAGGGFCYVPDGGLRPGKHISTVARRPGTNDGHVWVRPWLCLQDESDPRCQVPEHGAQN